MQNTAPVHGRRLNPPYDVCLNIESSVQARQLKTLSRLVNGAGNTFIGLDAVLRGFQVMVLKAPVATGLRRLCS